MKWRKTRMDFLSYSLKDVLQSIDPMSDLILQYQKYLCLTLITTVQMILLYTHCLNRVYYIRKCFVLLFIVDAHRFKSRNFNLVRYEQNVKYYEN